MGVTVWLLVAVRLGLGSVEGHDFASRDECLAAAEKRVEGMIAAVYPEGSNGVREPFAYFCVEGLRMPTADEIHTRK